VDVYRALLPTYQACERSINTSIADSKCTVFKIHVQLIFCRVSLIGYPIDRIEI